MNTTRQRIERLLVRTGGVNPENLFEIREAIAVVENSDTAEFCDIVFTDVGLLYLPYNSFRVTDPALKLTNTVVTGIMSGCAADPMYCHTGGITR